MMVFTLAARELRSLFLSPLAWAILAAVQGLMAYFFLWYLQEFTEVQPQLISIQNAPGITQWVVMPLLATAAIVLLVVGPLLTMRLISEERRNQTLSLLMSAPVSMSEIVIGKYLGILGFFLVMVGLIVLMPLSLLFGTTLDMGMFASGVFGLVLLLAGFAAVGLYMSTLTSQPAVAAISTFGVLLMLWIANLSSTSTDKDSLLSYISMLQHYQAMMKGIVNTGDIAYYLLFISVFLVLSIRHLDARRLQN
ncbi:MAG: ABC transporter permease subunit [Gammaproteobacteria bacterium]|jgi:ABC-2 type transport system permease protein